jgi:hypothetical protein
MVRSAPKARKALAQPQAIDWSLAIPVTNERLLALKQRQGRKINHVGFSSSRVALCAQDGERVANISSSSVGMT